MLTIKSFEHPDAKRRLGDKSCVESVPVGGGWVVRAVYEPGWRWSTHLKPVVGTPTCGVSHQGYVLSGRYRIKTDDGQEGEVGPGQVFEVGPGHDAWVVGDERCVIVYIPERE